MRMSNTVPSGIHIRRVRAADAPGFAEMMGHPEVFSNLLQMPLPNPELWRQRLEQINAPDRTDLQLVAEHEGEIVGGLGLHPMPQLRRRHCAMLGISVVPAAQRQGIGAALMQAGCDYADGWAQILRIELTVFTDNTRAIALYERFGFRTEGTHRAYAMRRGRYEDVLCMARLHPHPPQATWPGAE